jgi:stage V sporulation protein G
MNITDVRVKRVGNEGKLKAYVSVTFDDSFVVHNLKVIDGQSGIFVAMPSRKTTSGEFKDVAHPINSAFREVLQKAVLEAYNLEREKEESKEQREEKEQ